MDLIYAMKKEMFRRRYSVKTIKSYSYCVKKFLNDCGKESKKITKKDIREFMDKIRDKNYSGNTINIYWNSLKFLIGDILRKNWNIKVDYSKVPKNKPVFLDKKEIIRLFKAIENKKHRLMISLMYSAGLRVSELVHLKVKDLELENSHGWVRHGKGNKDRIFIIAEKLKNNLISFIKNNKLEKDSWLFNGNNSCHLSTSTVRRIIKKARKKAKIDKNIHPHTLRHSFATHLIEDKNDILAAQSLLGHSSMETTMGYVHRAYPVMINVKSPFDTL